MSERRTLGQRLAGLWDIREGEARPVLSAFASLFLLIAAHTILETARDALFLVKLGPSRLTWVYGALAALSFIVSARNGSFIRRFGQKSALVLTLVVAAYGTTVLYFQKLEGPVVFGLYLWSGLLGTVMVVQFWTFAGRLFTVSQGKRVLGLVAAGGVLGAAVGATLAAAALSWVPMSALLLVAAGLFFVNAVLVTSIRSESAPADSAPLSLDPPPVGDDVGAIAVLRKWPFLIRVGALVALSTAAVLATDFLFKSVAVASIPPAELGVSLARFYAALNAVALVVQVLVSGAIVRRLGVLSALLVTPLLLLMGSGATLAFGATLGLVLLTKAVDGALRHSLHRVTTELVSLPLPAEAREQAKPFLDSALVRGVQAVTAGLLLALGLAPWSSPRVLAGVVVALSVGWLVSAAMLRRPYLDLFRRALARGSLDPAIPDELDVESIEAVMEALSSRDADRVVAAIDLLAAKGRVRLIPGLVLYHESEEVLLRALEVISRSERDDWVPLAERLLQHTAEPVRVAAVRAIATRGASQALERAVEDPCRAVRAHAAFAVVLDAAPETDPRIVELLGAEGEDGKRGRIALLDAIRDRPDRRWSNVAMIIAEDCDPEIIEHAVAAMAGLRDERFIPVLIARLAVRDGRAAVREGIVALGEPALTALEEALRDPETDPAVQVHVPRTISRFATQRAADILVRELGREQRGVVRYKILRGLGRLATDHRIKVDRSAIFQELRRNLLEHFRMLSVAVPLERGHAEHPARVEGSGGLVLGLLQDKARQSLERSFRLLQIAHRNEDIRNVYLAVRSSDRRRRANALEFLDVLTARASTQVERDLRELFQLAADDLPDADRVERAARFVPARPARYEEAVLLLVREKDASIAALAAYHALELDEERLTAGVEAARRDRPSLLTLGGQVLAPALFAEAALVRP